MNRAGGRIELSVFLSIFACARECAVVRVLLLSVGFASMSVTAGCEDEGSATVARPSSSIEESVLYGGARCQSDSDCPGGVCAGAECVGFLVIPSDMARDQAGDRLKVAIAGNEPAARRLAVAAAGVVADSSAETFGRARAADIFRFLPCELADDALLHAMGAGSEAVRFYASRSLALCGYDAGIRELELFLQHASEPVRLMSRSALETVKTK